MVSSSFFGASGWRAVLAALGIAVNGQIDCASTARAVRRFRKFIGDFLRLRLLDRQRFQRNGIIA
jgi:hypothetical protein